MKIKMSLLENAYDYLHNSLYFYHLATYEEYPDDYKRFWKFSIVNIIQSMELMFKEVLRRENEIFIYENIDKPKNTVSVTTAIHRLKNIVKIDIDESDERIIKRAIELRNLITHFELELNVRELSTIYTIVFEFLYSFHHRFLGVELHEHIHEQYWEEEGYLIEQFKSEFVPYNGISVHRNHPIVVAESQLFPYFEVEGVKYKRIKYGEESGVDYLSELCPDCAVKQGYFHAFNCDDESCPKCGGQAISCSCQLYKNFFEDDVS
ncbi:hypothetical protein BBD41_27190 [Paenibacillus ihbetae]|uniref:Uncharacterized protein n=1 Tax=Paenibacillus ihbetae TaxID=1870820 RepID=A0A1B2E7K6_9BACL|nr:hypothetical protein [Paenibacillus ihbetae]ANY75963.1 hypothetical protein BBD41_27190 [Paenibacillus ihbetae]